MTQPNKSIQPKDNTMEIDDKSKKQILSSLKSPRLSTISSPKEDTGFENMDENEPKECIKIKQPLEEVSFNIRKKQSLYFTICLCLFV